MIKIFVKKNDSVDAVVEQVVAAPDLNLILVIPRFSKLNDSVSHFHALKKQAEAIGKKIIIESVDDHVLALAKASHLESVNPFFNEGSHMHISDIVRRSRDAFQSKEDEEVEEIQEAVQKSGSSRGRRRKSGGVRRLVYAAVFLAAFGGIAATGMYVLPKAEIRLVAKKAAWEYQDKLLVDKAGAEVVGQVFSKEQNQSFSFPATGSKKGDQKATGVITIYNAYGGESQYLVATTRFMTPDGKIFRLNKGVTVPGAKTVGGKLVPSSIDAAVTADKSGVEYNIGPVARFSIPGFQGTPRHDGFYGESKNAMTGGAAGEISFATPEDIAKGKQLAREQMRKQLETFLLAQIDSEFRVVPSSTQFAVLKENPIEGIADGKFSIFLDARADVMAFREKDAISVLTAKAQKELGPEYALQDYDLSFQPASVDFQNQKASVPVQFKGNFAYAIDASRFVSQAAGKREADLRTLIEGMPAVQGATVKLWPFYVFSVPSKENRIKVVIE